MAQAISAQDVKDSLASTPRLTLPSTLTDAILLTYITEQTAVVLTLRGIADLPAAGKELDLVKGAVRELVCLQVRRYIRPDDADYLDALRRDREQIFQQLEAVSKQGVPQRFIELVDSP